MTILKRKKIGFIARSRERAEKSIFLSMANIKTNMDESKTSIRRSQFEFKSLQSHPSVASWGIWYVGVIIIVFVLICSFHFWCISNFKILRSTSPTRHRNTFNTSRRRSGERSSEFETISGLRDWYLCDVGVYWSCIAFVLYRFTKRWNGIVGYDCVLCES